MPEDRLERLAGAIADGTPVDWKLEESGASADERPLVRELRVVAEIAAAAHGPAPGDTWGPLRLVSLLGSGAYGEVFRAHDDRLARDVALKLLRPGVAASDVAAEGRTLAKLRHPGVVTVYGADDVGGRTGIWMELVEGRTLGELLHESGPWDARTAALAGVELLGALTAVHGAGLVHRDVKPQNVMREAGGRIVVTDFGVSRLVAEREPRPAGTPLFMAPELLAGGTATPRSDIYSAGVLLYHMVTGGYPVTASDASGLARAHAAGERRRLRDARPSLPEGFVRVVERALQPDPARRFATAGEMQQALLAWLVPDRTSPTPEPGSGRRVRLAAAAALALVALTFVWRAANWSERRAPTLQATPPAAPATAAESPSQSPPARTARGDPFVPPLGAPVALDPLTPAPDVPYTIEATHDIARAELRVRTSAALSLYVVAIDEADRTLLVFPIPGRSPANPLVPGQEARLSTGSTPRGSRLVAVASPQVLVDLENELARLRQPLPSGPGPLPLTPAALSHLGHSLGLAPRDLGRFLAGARRLPEHLEMTRGVWIRRVDRSAD